MTGYSLQDVVVTVFAVLALVVLLRPLLPAWLWGRPAAPDTSPCASCAAGAAASRAREHPPQQSQLSLRRP